jgi:hypothetical protein
MYVNLLLLLGVLSKCVQRSTKYGVVGRRKMRARVHACTHYGAHEQQCNYDNHKVQNNKVKENKAAVNYLSSCHGVLQIIIKKWYIYYYYYNLVMLYLIDSSSFAN